MTFGFASLEARTNASAIGTSSVGTVCIFYLSLRVNLSRAAEEQNVSIRVLELEASKAVVRVLEWLGELNAARQVLCRQCIGIRHLDVGVPPRSRIPCMVRDGCDADILEHNHGAFASNDTKEGIVTGFIEGHIKA